MIGDTIFDIAMARAANVRAIGVAWGYHEPSELIEAGAEVDRRDSRRTGGADRWLTAIPPQAATR